MALSPNYGFPEPDNSSLVKNGAQDIRALGDSIDSFLFRPFGINAVLNSAFQVWQRGISVAVASSSYTADRWQMQRTGGATTVSRQVTGDTTNLPNIQYCARLQRDSGDVSTNSLQFAQSFETINSIPFVGKTVTLSFYARKGADYSAASNILGYRLNYGTGTDQNVISGYTGNVSLIANNATLTNTWQRFTATATIPVTATELGIRFLHTPTGTAGANDYAEVTGVQLEAGSVATPFKTYAGTIQGELAACQRYYYRYNNSGNGSAIGTSAYGLSTTVVDFAIPFPVVQRVTPTSIDSSSVQIYNAATATQYTTGTVTNAPSTSAFMGVARYTHGTGVFTTGTTYYPNGGTSAYVGFSAEL